MLKKRYVGRSICGAISLFAMMVAGCSQDIKQIKITETNEDELFQQILEDSNQLTVEEDGLLQAYLFRKARENMAKITSGEKAKDSKVHFVGMTIGEMIEDQRKWQVDEEKRKVDAKVKTEAGAQR
jgi:hypothetical protein